MKSHNKMHTHNNAYENKELVYKTLKDLVKKKSLVGLYQSGTGLPEPRALGC